MTTGFVVTREWINEHRTDAGSWTRLQLAQIGVAWPPLGDWRTRAEGREISGQQRAIFESRQRRASMPIDGQRVDDRMRATQQTHTVAVGALCPFCQDGIRFELRGSRWMDTQQGQPHMCAGIASALAMREPVGVVFEQPAGNAASSHQRRPTPLDAVAQGEYTMPQGRGAKSLHRGFSASHSATSAQKRQRRPVQLELQAVD